MLRELEADGARLRDEQIGLHAAGVRVAGRKPAELCTIVRQVLYKELHVPVVLTDTRREIERGRCLVLPENGALRDAQIGPEAARMNRRKLNVRIQVVVEHP